MSTPVQTASEARTHRSPASDASQYSPAADKPAAPADELLLGLLIAAPVRVADIEAAAKAAGMSMRTIERAKQRLGIKTARAGKGWCWSLPQERHPVKPQEQAAPSVSEIAPNAPPGPAFPLGMVQARPGYTVVRFGRRMS